VVRNTRIQQERYRCALVLVVFLGSTAAGCTVLPDGADTMPANAPEHSTNATSVANNQSARASSDTDAAAASPTLVDAASPPPQANSSGASGTPSTAAAAGRIPSEAGQSGSGGAGEGAGTGAGDSRFGTPCESDMTCPGGMCVKGHCCGVRECGTCERCGADGRCAKITDEADPYSCDVSVGMCDAKGICVLKNGSDCSPDVGPGAARCASGHCDVHCCAITCGVCQRCEKSGNGCEPVAFADDVGGCSGTTSCSNGECVEVPLNTAFRGNQLTLLPGEEIAQTFNLRVAGEMVEIRVDTTCDEPLSVRQLSDNWSNITPPDQELIAAYPRPTDEGESMVSYVIKPALRVEFNQRFAFVLHNSSNGRCSASIGIADPLASANAFIRSSGSTSWTEQVQQSLSFKVLMRLQQ
jgi:hypothetical protein